MSFINKITPTALESSMHNLIPAY